MIDTLFICLILHSVPNDGYLDLSISDSLILNVDFENIENSDNLCDFSFNAVKGQEIVLRYRSKDESYEYVELEKVIDSRCWLLNVDAWWRTGLFVEKVYCYE